MKLRKVKSRIYKPSDYNYCRLYINLRGYEHEIMHTYKNIKSMTDVKNRLAMLSKYGYNHNKYIVRGYTPKGSFEVIGK